MPHITSIQPLEILDSRGNPTLQVTITLSTHAKGTACVPSGASTGEHEAHEMRDGDKERYNGKGVQSAVHTVESIIQPALKGVTIESQKQIDDMLIALDGTPNKTHLGANSILGVSLALARALANNDNLPLYAHLSKGETPLLPMPMINIINGGAHADNTIDFQEFMIRPIGASSFSKAMQMASETFHALSTILKANNLSTNVGDEGGFAPNIPSAEKALDYICSAIEKAGYVPGKDISIALDCAASFMYDKETNSYIEKKKALSGKKFTHFSAEEMTLAMKKLVAQYPIDSIEDILDENDWQGWEFATRTLGDKCMIVGDDLFVTSTDFIQKGIDKKSANAVLIKPNQIGTLSETLDAINLSKRNGLKTIISHRSGDTEDTFIADLAVATKSGHIKTGSMSRSERIAKYNRLLTIEKELGDKSLFNK